MRFDSSKDIIMQIFTVKVITTWMYGEYLVFVEQNAVIPLRFVYGNVTILGFW